MLSTNRKNTVCVDYNQVWMARMVNCTASVEGANECQDWIADKQCTAQNEDYTIKSNTVKRKRRKQHKCFERVRMRMTIWHTYLTKLIEPFCVEVSTAQKQQWYQQFPLRAGCTCGDHEHSNYTFRHKLIITKFQEYSVHWTCALFAQWGQI